MTATIPSFHVSSLSKAKGSALVFIANRQAPGHTGTFNVQLDAHFDPAADPYPSGSLTIKIDMNDGVVGTVTATSFELMNSYGRQNPTIYLTGRCKVDGVPQTPDGCKFWLMVANNKKPDEQQTADVIGFIVDDRNGNRLAYGTGPVRSGDITVAAPGV